MGLEEACPGHCSRSCSGLGIFYGNLYFILNNFYIHILNGPKASSYTGRFRGIFIRVDEYVCRLCVSAFKIGPKRVEKVLLKVHYYDRHLILKEASLDDTVQA